nr:TPA_asm: tail fiber [Spodoptera moth adintovirus 1]
MNVDKFGHFIHKRLRISDLFEFNDNALLKSESGDFDLKASRLRGVRSPVDGDDAVNKDYVDRLSANTIHELNKLIGALRSQLTLDAQKTVQTTLKTKIPEALNHLEDKFYTKADIDKLLKKL